MAEVVRRGEVLAGSEEEMLELGEKFAGEILEGFSAGSGFNSGSGVVIELVGDVGAGKTTFTRGLAKGLGVTEPVTSPSFVISKSYAFSGGGRLVHYDFYRLSDPGLMMEDLAENIDDLNTVVVVEWAETVADLLPEGRMVVRILIGDDGRRVVRAE